MAGAVVQSKLTVGTAGAGLAQAAFAANNTAGNALVVVAFDLAVSGRTFAITDTNNSWGTAKVTISDNDENSTMVAFVLGNCAAGANTVKATCTNGATDQVAMMQAEISGVTTSPFDVGAGAFPQLPGTSANAVSSGHGTSASTAFMLALAMYTNGGSGSNIAAGTGFTSSASGNIVVRGWSGMGFGSNPACLEWQASMAAGSNAATFTDATDGTAASYDVIMVMLDESGSGSSSTPGVGTLGASGIAPAVTPGIATVMTPIVARRTERRMLRQLAACEWHRNCRGGLWVP